MSDIREYYARLNKMRRHFYVYRAYDIDGRLLYIGSTGKPMSRWSSHKKESLWAKYAARFKLQGPYLEWTARRLEMEAIADERPFFNAMGNPWVRSAYNDAAKAQMRDVFERVGNSGWTRWVTSGERIRFNEEWRESHYLSATGS